MTQSKINLKQIETIASILLDIHFILALLFFKFTDCLIKSASNMPADKHQILTCIF